MSVHSLKGGGGGTSPDSANATRKIKTVSPLKRFDTKGKANAFKPYSIKEVNDKP